MEETVEVVVSSCIICMQNTPELKPSDGGGIGEGVDLKPGLDLFGTLLRKSNGDGGTGSSSVVEEDPLKQDYCFSGRGGDDWLKPVCCEQCKKALEDILRLQEIIEQNQAWQMENVESLKNLVIESTLGALNDDPSGDRVWTLIRDLLINRLHNSHLTRQVITQTKPVLPEREGLEAATATRKRERLRKQQGSAQFRVVNTPAKLKTCSVDLQRLNETEIQQYVGQSARQHIKIESLSSPPVIRSVRQSKLKAFAVIRQSVGKLQADITYPAENDDNDHLQNEDTLENVPPNKKRKDSEDLMETDFDDVEGDYYQGEKSDNVNFSPSASSEEDEDKDESGSTSDGGREFKLTKNLTKQGPQKGKIKRECETCRKKFTKIGNYKLHVQIHLPNHLRKKFVCPTCSKESLSIYSLRKHMKRKHQTDWSQLDKNSIVVTESKDELEDKRVSANLSHIATDFDADRGDADYMEEKSDNCNILLSPVSQDEGKDDGGCTNDDDIDKEFSVRNNLPREPRKGKGKLHCEKCSKTFTKICNYKLHIKTHLPSHLREKFVCPTCSRKSLSIYSLRRHMEDVHQTEWSQLDKDSIVVTTEEAVDKLEESRIEGKFQCKTCGKRLPKRSMYETHIATHLPKHLRKKYVCPTCHSRYLSIYSLRDHMEQAHQTDWSQVDTTAITVAPGGKGTSQDDYQNNKKMESRNKGVKDKNTREARRQNEKASAIAAPAEKTSLLKENHPNEERLKLLFTESFLLIKEGVLLFKYTTVKSPFHGQPQGLTCEEAECGWRIDGRDYYAFQQLREHITTVHYNEPDYASKTRTCELCEGSTFPDGKELKEHLLNVHYSDPDDIFIIKYLCEVCWKPVRSESNLQSHILRHQSNEEKTLVGVNDKPIRRWGRPRKSMEEMRAQQQASRERRKQNKYDCRECGRRFGELVHLKTHEETHIPKEFRKKFTCPQCNFQVLSKVALRSHISRQHQPELAKPPRICTICSKTFHYRDGEGFRVHMRGHTGERPFQCDQCGKNFISNGQLRTHKTSHGGTIAFQCEYCPMKYKYIKGLTRHLKSAHKDKLPEQDPERVLQFTNIDKRPDFHGPKIAYPCPVCEKVFPLRSRMTKHVRTSHEKITGDLLIKLESGE